MKKTALPAIALLFLLSCSAFVSDPGPAVAPEQQLEQKREELFARIKTLESENDPRGTRKYGLRYLGEFPGSSEIREVTVLTASACAELGFLSEARSLMLPLAGEGVESSARADALVMIAKMDAEKGRFEEAAAGLLSALSLEMGQAAGDSARSALERSAGFLSAAQLERLRGEYPSSRGADIILDACMVFAAAGADSAYMDALRSQLVSLDSLDTVPDRVSARVMAPAERVSVNAAQEAVFRVGLLCPLSGRFAPLGEAFLAGASLAVKESRMRGKAAVDLAVGDTKADVLEAHRVAQRMVRDENIRAIVGDMLSSTTIVAAQVAQQYGAVLYSPAASQAGLESIGDFVFQAPTDYEWQIQALARIACVKMGLRRFAFLSAFNHQAAVTEKLFRSSVEYHGGALVVSDYYDEGSTDFLADIERIRRADPEALFIASDLEDLILILPQLSFYEFGVQLLGTNDWNSGNLLRMAGRDMAGAVFPADSDVAGDETMYRMAAAFTGGLAGEVNRFSVAGYAGVRRMLEAMALSAASGTPLKDEMRRGLESGRHRYIDMLTGDGIRFNTVRNEAVAEYSTLRAGD
jgi:branched-chain amino acid transport system substrate-binding protein